MNSRTKTKIFRIGGVFVLLGIIMMLVYYFGKSKFWTDTAHRRNWKGIEGYQRKTEQFSPKKWIIVTTIGNPTMKALQKLFSLKDWEFVCVADTKTPDWGKFNLSANVHFLSVETQKGMTYRILDFLPYKHYARKNIGYLYAIERGAQVIYETDDDTILVEETLEYIDEWVDLNVKTVWSSTGAVNAYDFFRDEDSHYIWPRGLPLQQLPLLKNEGVVKECNNVVVFSPVQQYLQDIDPDVDAIYRLTHSEFIKNYRYAKKDRIAIGVGTFSPYNTQNTITLYSAFWGLLLPVTVNFRVCDIWRGYWAQRILWEIGGRVTFANANCDHIRNPHDYFKDYVDEFQLYSDGQRFLDMLKNWRRKEGHGIFDAILDLAEAMVDHKFWDYEDYLLMEAWLKDLIDIGYKPPSPVDFDIDGHECKD